MIKTALVLGGGGARGAYQIGVWQALRELGIEIDMVMGTSVGAVNGAAIAQGNFDEAVALWKSLEARSVADIRLCEVLHEHIDEKSVRESPLDFGMVTLEVPKITPRYLFRENIPEGKLIEFLQASSAFFPAVVDIDDVKYVDGGYYDNLPVNMAIGRGAHKIIAVDLDSIGIIKRAPRDGAADIRSINCSWPLGSVTVFDKINSMRIMRLGYLDTMKSYGAFDGNAYTFMRGTLDRRLLNGAECAGKILELDPSLIYSGERFHKKLKAAFDSHAAFMEYEISTALCQLRQRPGGGLARLLKQLNGKSLTVALFQLISDGILTRPTSRIFPSEMAAAAYLHRCLKSADTHLGAVKQ